MTETMNQSTQSASESLSTVTLISSQVLERISSYSQVALQLNERLTNLADLNSQTTASVQVQISEAEQAITTKLQEGRTSLNSLQGGISQARAQLESISVSLTGKMDSLSTEIQAIETELEGSMTRIANTFDTLAENTQTLDTQFQSNQDESIQLIDSLDQQVEQARNELRSQMETLTGHTDSLQQELSLNLETIVVSFSPLIQAGEEQRGKLETSLMGHSETIHQALAMQFGDQVKGELLRLSDQLNDAMDTLRQVSETANAPAIQNLKKVMGEVDEVLDLVDEIKPALELVVSTLG